MGRSTSFGVRGKDYSILENYVSKQNGFLLDADGNKVDHITKAHEVFYVAFPASVIAFRNTVAGTRQLDFLSSDVIELAIGGEGKHYSYYSEEPAFHAGRIYLYIYRDVPEWLCKEYDRFSRFIKKTAVRKYILASQLNIYFFPIADQFIEEVKIDVLT